MAENPVRKTLPGEMEPDSELIDRVVERIRELHLRKGLEYYMELGELLIEELFDGDAAAVTTRAAKHASYRALAKRDDLPVQHVTLNAAVRVRRQFAVLPDDVRGRLSFSHHKELLPLLTDKQRVRLATDALKNAWSVRDLKKEVQKTVARARKGEKRGRPALPRFQKTIRALGRVLDNDEAFQDLDKLSEMDQEEVQALHETVLSMKQECERLQEELRKRMPGFATEDSDA